MITKILKYIQNITLDFIDYLTSIPSYIRKFLTNITVFIHDQKIKFQDILQTNIELGKHHLFRGQISDALLRFRIAHTLFDPQNKEINYWLGLCYFLKGNYDTAIPYLEEGKEFDSEGIYDFIKACDTASIVPESLWNIIRKVSIAASDDRYYMRDSSGGFVDLPQEFIRFCVNNIKYLKSDMEIIDYGCGTGLIGSMIDHTIEAEYKITAIENVDMFVDYVGEIRGDRGRIYDNVFLSSLHDTKNMFRAKKYDFILSFDSLNFTKDLSPYFQNFAKGLKTEGFAAILLPISTKIDDISTVWSKSNKSFIYTKKDIENQLKLAEFEILDIKIWKLNAKKSFIGFICTK